MIRNLFHGMDVRKCRIICSVIAVAVIVLFAGQAMAKCPVPIYEIKAVVKDKCTKQPVSQARLFVFFDENKSTWSPKGDPEYFMTNGAGAVSAKAHFDSYSGWFLTEVCGKRPSMLMVFVIADGYDTNRRILIIDNLKSGVVSDPDKYERAIELPTIMIDRRSRECSGENYSRKD